jgi:hypothetical protein
MKISDRKKQSILEKRNLGFSFTRIAKETKISRSSVIKIIKDSAEQPKDGVIEAKILRSCPNPRIIYIYFNGDKADFAKCVVRAGLNYPANKLIRVKPIETSDEKLYKSV